MNYNYLVFLIILLIVMFFSVRKNKLTLYGSITGGVIGSFVFSGAGFTGVAMIGLFFLLGTGATSWKIKTKERLGVAEKNKGKRTAGQVIANGGVAALAGFMALVFPLQGGLFRLMMAASLASATADTLSSELGTLYGKNFYNIISFRHDKRGENGVISLEGTLIGIAGSILIAVVYAVGYGWDTNFVWIVIAGTAGNITDSVLGATLERNQYVSNDAVNFTNTLLAALLAFGLYEICSDSRS